MNLVVSISTPYIISLPQVFRQLPPSNPKKTHLFDSYTPYLPPVPNWEHRPPYPPISSLSTSLPPIQPPAYHRADKIPPYHIHPQKMMDGLGIRVTLSTFSPLPPLSLSFPPLPSTSPHPHTTGSTITPISHTILQNWGWWEIRGQGFPLSPSSHHSLPAPSHLPPGADIIPPPPPYMNTHTTGLTISPIYLSVPLTWGDGEG